jgi:pyruvate formate lyase activating enzyme
MFCQNWHYREIDPVASKGISAKELVSYANLQTYCVCFFGGDPASQMPHALASAKLLSEENVTICWETAGTANLKLMNRALQYSLQTNGCIKFDLKAYSEALHISLTGRSNRQTLENFSRTAIRFAERPTPPLIIASTLLVPGYVNASEVRKIAAFIANINPDIPYALLGFAPQFMMTDLPPTSVNHAQTAYEAAKQEGLNNVRIGNRHLLGTEYLI